MTEAKEKLRAVVELLEYIDEKLPGMTRIRLVGERPDAFYMYYCVDGATVTTVEELIMPHVNMCASHNLIVATSWRERVFNIEFRDFVAKTDQLDDAILNFLRAHDKQLDEDLKALVRQWQKNAV